MLVAAGMVKSAAPGRLRPQVARRIAGVRVERLRAAGIAPLVDVAITPDQMAQHLARLFGAMRDGGWADYTPAMADEV